MDTATLRLIFYILLFILGGAVYSLVISNFTRNWILRYLPSLAGSFLIPYLIYRMYFGNLEGFLPLAYLIFIFTVAAVILGNVFANIIIRLREKSGTRH